MLSSDSNGGLTRDDRTCRLIIVPIVIIIIKSVQSEGHKSELKVSLTSCDPAYTFRKRCVIASTTVDRLFCSFFPGFLTPSFQRSDKFRLSGVRGFPLKQVCDSVTSPMYHGFEDSREK